MESVQSRSARRGSYVAGSGALALVALAVVTNYVTSSVPTWAENPWTVWGVFTALAVTSLLLQLWGRRLDTNAGGPAGRPVAVGRIVAGAAGSLTAPVLHRPVRGREAVVAQLERLLPDSRADKWRLFRRPGSSERFAIVAGAGGMGKTTVAAMLAKRAATEKTPVFWIRWRTEAEFAEQMVQVAVACGLPEEGLEAARAGRAGLADTVWAHLALTKRWLIVLDNLDDPDALTGGSGPVHDYRGWIRPGQTGLLLVTSRVTDPDVWGSAATLIKLAPLPEQDGAQVLLDSAPAAGGWEEAQLLADRLGGLPLALYAAARYLSAPGSRYRTFTTYRQALDTELESLLGAEHPRASNPEIARTVVRHTWELSFEQLAADGNTLARPALQLLSLLAPAPVPLSLLHPELVTEATGLAASPVAVEAAVNGLHIYGLLNLLTDVNGEPAPGLVVLHPLVREITALTLTEHTTSPETWHHALAHSIGQAIDDVSQLDPNDRVAPRHLALHGITVAALAGNADDTGLLSQLQALAWQLEIRRADAEAMVVSQYVASALYRLLGPDDPDTLASLNNLASALDSLGRYQEAVDLHRQNLDDRTRILGPDHPDTLASLNNLAAALENLGHYQEAADLHQQNLDDRTRILGPDHPDTLASLNNFANALAGLGHYRPAADLHRQSVDDRTRVLGPDHPDTLASLNNLAAALENLGHYQEAADLHRQNLDDRTRILGPDHPDTLASLNNLANSLASLGRYQEAVDLHRQSIDDRTRVLGPDHPDTLASLNNLASALDRLGQHPEAADLHRQSVDDRTRVLGPDHPDTLASRNNLANSLASLGRYQEAVDLHRQSIDDRTRVLGPDHPDTLVSRNNLANVLHRLGQDQEAHELHRRNHSARLGVLGLRHPDTLASSYSIAVTLANLGRYQEAALLHRETLDNRIRVLGPDHPDTLASRNNLADAQAALGHRSRWYQRLGVR
ncbi:tetratricopeptide repeat protein [Streptomyces sp. NPDC013489]|uniref:tetratricopeptide repeat protein n=1 Tax=Streptomyces sp. NPDC013489 TaxID=3155606 RepID=UPI0033FC63D4